MRQQFRYGGLQVIGDGLALIGFHGYERVGGRVVIVELAIFVGRGRAWLSGGTERGRGQQGRTELLPL